MNHITFNDPAKKLTSLAFGPEHEKEMSSLLSRSSLESPLFEWESFGEDKLMSTPNDCDVMDLLSNEEHLLPFKRFRLQINSNPESKALGMDAEKLWLHHSAGTLTVLHVMTGKHAVGWKHLLKIRKDSREVETVCTFMGKLVDQEALKKAAGAEEMQPGKGIFRSLAWFIREYGSPQNFVVSVAPDKKGKSVEWLQPRTHYVLLNRNHPANNKTVQKGANISPGDEYIKKRAHSRRAHARILRSPRFKNKVGQTIRVKACWVGPDEWKQFGTIYRMAHLRNAKRTCADD